ncbi:hypothetical protein [Rhodoblastus sp.]|jgi:hypothetical protein|uniref:hypothetical protein n=1 Tax=Rhodoblastus sp. TaxID=1962975 RepID=UPI0025D1A27C|nr:hypothetical protein [Rhodoblastus sp.]
MSNLELARQTLMRAFVLKDSLRIKLRDAQRARARAYAANDCHAAARLEDVTRQLRVQYEQAVNLWARSHAAFVWAQSEGERAARVAADAAAAAEAERMRKAEATAAARAKALAKSRARAFKNYQEKYAPSPPPAAAPSPAPVSPVLAELLRRTEAARQRAAAARARLAALKCGHVSVEGVAP